MASNSENKEESTNQPSSSTVTQTKVVLLGETAVGKSCLISRFVNDKFESNFVPTMGGCYSSKEVVFDKVDKTIKFDIWDTAGQEKYRSINKIFYQDAAVAILVFDITRKDSFEEMKNYWYKEVRDNSPKDIIIAIAANKSDLYEYEDVNSEEVEDFAKKIGAVFKETSALNGSGISELFNAIGYKILSPENYEEFMKKTHVKKSIKLINKNDSNVNDSSTGNEAVVDKSKKGCC